MDVRPYAGRLRAGARDVKDPTVTSASAPAWCPLPHDDLQGENLARGGLWQVTESRRQQSAHGDSDVSLEIGDMVRCEQSGQFGDDCSWATSYLFRFHILTGASAGAFFLLETDANANLVRFELRSVAGRSP